jgi:hypothetical protein
MRKRFNISDLTISLGLIFVFAADILQMAFAQLELPPKEVSTKQLPIIPIMQYQIQLMTSQK